MTRKPLHLLLAEDSDDDALLVLNSLERDGFEVLGTRVKAAADFRAALEDGGLEIILCHFPMATFDAITALEILRESGKNIPLIIISGTAGEAAAVEAMRLGASDYLLDNDVFRLGAAVDRELRDSEVRRKKCLSDGSARAHANEIRYMQQRNALISLTRGSEPDTLGTHERFQRITETTARTLGVGRVSIWRYTADRTAIECLDLYEIAKDLHSSGILLVASDYPSYFRAIDSMELISANDALNDPCTFEFSAAYLIPLGIGSMMDVPVRLGSTVDHLLCCEHVGGPRDWTADEKTFAVAIGNLISLAVETHQRTIAQEEVLRSHQRFQSVASATNDTIWDWDLETNAFWWNDGLANLFGWKTANNTDDINAWIRQIHPEDRSRVVAGIYATLREGGVYWNDEYRFVSNHGSVAQVLDRGQVIRDASGKAIRMVGGMMDLSASRTAEIELGRSHRALKMLSSCNEMLIRASDEIDLLVEACRIAVEIGGYRMAWVGYAMEDERRRIDPMAHAGEEHGYLAEIDLTWADDHLAERDPAGQAICSGETVVIENALAYPDSADWVEPASVRGYRSVVSLPLRGEQRVFGVLCLYGSEAHPAGADEVMMLQEMANDLSFGIENVRARKERQRTEEVVIKVAQAVSTGIGSEFFDRLTLNMVEALGAFGGLIGRLNTAENLIETISYVEGGRMVENVTYGLSGTPCDQTLKGDVCVFENAVRQMFPQDHMLAVLDIEAYAGIPLLDQHGEVSGIMAVVFTGPLQETALVKSTLRIFAARAASELDRRQADARIREQASLLDRAQDAILVRDLDHIITYWNKSAERLYGWTAEEAIGRSIVDLLYQENSGYLTAHAHTLQAGEWLGELDQVDKNGDSLVIEGRWTLVRDEAGRPESVLAINTDISEYRRLEQQFIRAQRLESIGTLAGGIAHDLNNILAPITMAVELMKMREPDARNIDLLDTIAASAKRGANMVGQVLSFARGMEGHQVQVHPWQVVTELETILRDTFPRSIELVVAGDRDLWTIHGDPTRIQQVLLNLCVNSRDAITGAGRISVRAENVHLDPAFAAVNLEAREGPYVFFEVEDSGEGIAPAIMDRIFDPFFTTKAVGKGTGLGLPTTLSIVKSHGGFIRVSSQQGEGTCVRVYLPAQPEAGGEAATSPAPLIHAGGGELILIVDDEAPIRQIARQTLEAFGYRILVAENGAEGLAIYLEHQSRIDVILTDMMMPVMDGPEMIGHIITANPHARIIASSGITYRLEGPDASMEHVRDFLPKPYTAETLLKCLRNVIDDRPVSR